ncbi:hypothetical protein N0V83_007296 [Neocucurbitaria cava]|uniref:Uncharacterized protein n=1 Tax=Neocucurbitaria cava TaxID=798079 RepID=A0A9W9CK33_9PLEO|nr:hypothetical protein N0V83_007296 [Neocucurbitaria cava]
MLLDKYMDLYEKQKALGEELKAINASISKHDLQALVRLMAATNEIDIDLSRKHAIERATLLKELHKKQSAKAEGMKEARKQLKAALQLKKDGLLKQRKDRLQAKSAVKQQLDQTMNSFSSDQLREAVARGLAPTALEKKRKRSEE